MHSRYLTNTSTPNTSPKHTPLHSHTHTHTHTPSTSPSSSPSIHPHNGILLHRPPYPPAARHRRHLFAATRYSTCYTDLLLPTADYRLTASLHITLDHTPIHVSLSTSRFRYTSYHNILLHQRVGMDYTSKYLQYIHNTFTTHLIVMKYVTQNKHTSHIHTHTPQQATVC